MSWRDAFRAYDDATLVALANPGLLRRAAKAVPVLVSEDASGGVIEVGGFTVHVGAAGPPGARCTCPATGVCEHILAAALLLRESEGSSAPDVAALDELLALDPLALGRAVGIAVVRRARADTATSAEITASPATVEIRFAGDERDIRFVAGAGFAGMASAYPATERAERHLTAVRVVFAAHGRDWAWPAGSDAVAGASAADLSREQRAAIAEAESVCLALVRSGLSHLGEDAADRLAAAGIAAGVSGLHRLARGATVASGIADQVVARVDTVAERDLASALAEVLALCSALLAADAERLPDLLGAARRSFDEQPTARLVPLDAFWWDAPSGARGATFTFADRDTGALVSSTAARASGSDVTFSRRSGTLIWGTSAERVTAGEFTLRRPRTDPAGSLAAGDLSSVDPGSAAPLTRAALDPLAVDDWSLLDGAAGARVTFGSRAVRPFLLAPASTAALELDEIGQRLVLPLLDRGRTRLDVSVRADLGSRADVLASYLENRATIAYAFVRRGSGAQRDVLDLTSIIVADAQGLRLVPLDFVSPARAAKGSALRKRLERLTARLAATPEPAIRVASSLVERIGLPVLDVLDEVAATGRPRLDERQLAILDRQRGLAADVALSALADAIAAVRADTVDHRALLRCYFVVDRALAVG